MKVSRVEALIWVLIYGGLLAVGLGLSVGRSSGALGFTVIAVGAVVAVMGVALVVVRSRMKDGAP